MKAELTVTSDAVKPEPQPEIEYVGFASASASASVIASTSRIQELFERERKHREE